VEIDRTGLYTLARDECLELLATAKVGRVGLSVAALPVIFTVNFARDGEDLVFRARLNTKLTEAIAGNIVCLQADELDADGHFGWSVAVTGPALLADEDASRLERLGLPNFVGASHWVRVSADVVSGRRHAQPRSALDLRHSPASVAQ
jgi:nitroimidazol reductase NimA-like FMN-containing flavoprotein (pyridoxamine 5'-phosphate oxidase superfamily)